MNKVIRPYLFFAVLIILHLVVQAQPRNTIDFNKDWKFLWEDDSAAIQPAYDDSKWRQLSLPHDWSIEGDFSKDHPATTQGGALPTGIGWYRKTFVLPVAVQNKNIRIEFDGVYRNSEVWINGHYLGKRPYGYSSFSYDLAKHIKAAPLKNVIVVKVDNSQQPNSRWYSGSGIYRNVRLVATGKIAIKKWGTFFASSDISSKLARVSIEIQIENNSEKARQISVSTDIYDASGKLVTRGNSKHGQINLAAPYEKYITRAAVPDPKLWSVDKPYLYKAVTRLYSDGKLIDEYSTSFGIRSFFFDKNKGFFLNDQSLKIKGVCLHHDLGALGAAVNTRAVERQLEILKAMGCNAIRTAHNPPAPELLELCDKMGFLVIVEAFDMWRKKKNKFDYFSDFEQWHKRDIEDMVLRDRNHPSVFMWSIGNEIREQFDSTGITITKELVDIVKKADPSRTVTAGLSEWNPEKNFMYKSEALDVVGLNYHHEVYEDFHKYYPGQIFLGAENMSAFATRGHYDMPSDSSYFWPAKSPQKIVENGNPDYTISAYDQVSAYWGSTHERTWKIIKKHDFLSGLFVWSGFDFLGEPIPYPWPARSSYYGIIDLAGFPKDVYYMYQSEWTTKPVLHIFPHWNWPPGKTVDVWAYYNNADEVELFLNGRSLGIKKKMNDELHVMWRVPFQAGTLKAVSRKNGKTVLTKEIKTAGTPYKIELIADRKTIKPDGKDLSFVTVRVLDKD
ncbi:MAG TPA: glycoside hydrolase family 2 TIM barrel-domain containing protein, partial [Chitinophagaceae bacterium]|nr:glycoside hydrolase family 2 TIM barrel-domain containing protein [Chitinophagaceae bacterium]